MNKPNIILTVGVPGVGKSTWARNYQQSHIGVEILERDIIREELQPGYCQGKPNKQFEKRVTEVSEKRLNEYLNMESTRTVIISDTNLNFTRRDQFIKKYKKNYEVELKVFTENQDLNLCLKRNRSRDKVVPDAIVIKFWKQYMTQFEPDPFKDIDKPLLFVGDIHSQYHKLLNMITFHGSDNYHFVFLGDINDSRVTPPFQSNTYISFLNCYYLIREMVEQGKATLIHSNHQKNLIRAIRGRRKRASWGLGNTLLEMEQNSMLEIAWGVEDVIESLKATEVAYEIANWLDSRPYFFRKDKVVGVHAEYKKKYCPHPYDVSGRGLEALIYGSTIPKTDDILDNRVHWWETYRDPLNYVVAGHYHHVYIGNECAVIDAGCGEDNGLLLTFDPLTKETSEF